MVQSDCKEIQESEEYKITLECSVKMSDILIEISSNLRSIIHKGNKMSSEEREIAKYRLHKKS